jgi:uncharacterized protein YidB (DUF937 family)
MGLLDILNGMQNGPRGPSQSSGDSSSGGMSPMTMALIGLLAYKALKHVGGNQPATPNDAGQSASLPSGGATASGGLGGLLGSLLGGAQTRATPASAPGGGGLSDLIPGGLGGLLGGAAAGSVLSGGLGTLIKDLQDSGHGQTAQSWVGTGPNQPIDRNDLASALGADTIDRLAQQTGMDRDELLEGLSQQLPDLVNHLTPSGRLPTSEEASRMV